MKTTFGNMWLRFGVLPLVLMALLTTSCEPDQDNTPGKKPVDTEQFNVYVISSGGFGKANATLDLYLPSTKKHYPQIFNSANNIPLGDTAQSAIVYGDELFVVVNNSDVIFKLDARTGKRLGQLKITGPRYIHVVSPEKAYVSHLGSGDITIFNPKTMTETGKIATYQSASGETNKYNLSTERWLKICDKNVMVSCWSNHEKVLVIDTTQDKVVKEITVGLQPKTMGIDKNGKVWILCEGKSWGKPPVGPSLWTVDTKADYATTKVADVPKVNNPEVIKWAPTSNLVMNLAGDAFYYANAPHVFKMSITDKTIPTEPFIKMPENTLLYSLAVAPNGDLYFSDVKDYKANATVYRYSATGTKLDSFDSGVLTIDYAFYVKK